MTRTFPIRIEPQKRTPIHREEQHEPASVTHSFFSLLRYHLIQVSIILLIVYVGFAVIHGLSYVPDEYVCHHMARDMEDILEPLGFDVKIVTGWKDLKNGTEITEGSSGHAWMSINGIDVDSVWLVPFPLRHEYPYKGKMYEDYTEYAKSIYTEDEYLERALAGEL